MIENTIANLEERLQKASAMDEESRAALLKLVAELKAEVLALEDSHGEHASSIVAFANLAVHEATRRERSEGLYEIAAKGFRKSIEGFEASHPRLTGVVSEIINLFSNIGI